MISSKKASCYMAGSLTKAGAGVAVIEYELAPKGETDTQRNVATK